MESDFDLATLNGKQNDYATALYASKNFWQEKNRTAMDDLESLLYTMWSVAGVPVGGPYGKYPEGRAHLDRYLEYKEDEWMMVCNKLCTVVMCIMYKVNVFCALLFSQEKLNYFTDEDVKRAFQFVQDEVISWGENPYYDDLIREFDIAITNVRMKSGQIEFEWLQNGSTSQSDIQEMAQKHLRVTSTIKASRTTSPRVTKNEFSGLISRVPDRPINMKKPPRLSRFAVIDAKTTAQNSPECIPKCFNNKKLKDKISSQLLKRKLDLQLMKSIFTKKSEN